jgi:hypothetical protein
MRYTPPKINSTYPAVTVVRSVKGAPIDETGSNLLSNGPAYQSEE